MPSQFSRTTRSLAGDTGAAAIAVWVCAVVLLTGWLSWLFLGHVTVYEISRTARLEVQQSAYPVMAVAASRIVKTNLALGQTVRAGEVLVELDARSAELRLQEESTRLAGFAPRIASLKSEIKRVKQVGADERRVNAAASRVAGFRTDEAAAAAEFAKENTRRLKDESAAGGVAEIEAARAAAEARKSRATRNALKAEKRRIEADARMRDDQHLANLENLRRSVVLLEGERATTVAVVARLRQEIEKHRIRAPADGIIGDLVPLREGAYVAEGQMLASVVPQGALVIVASFTPAAVLGRMHPGQLSRMRLDGFPWAEFGSIDARVTRVATKIRDNLVRVEFVPLPGSTPKAMLQHGLPGVIEVSVDRISPAALVLRSAGQLSTAPASIPAAPATSSTPSTAPAPRPAAA